MPTERGHTSRSESHRHTSHTSKGDSKALVPHSSSRTHDDRDMKTLTSGMSGLKTSTSTRHRSSSTSHHEPNKSHSTSHHEPSRGESTSRSTHHSSSGTHRTGASSSNRTARPQRTRALTGLTTLAEDREVTFVDPSGTYRDSMALTRIDEGTARPHSNSRTGSTMTQGHSAMLTRPSSTSNHRTSSSNFSIGKSLVARTSTSTSRHGESSTSRHGNSSNSKALTKPGDKTLTKVEKQADGKNVTINVNKTIIINNNIQQNNLSMNVGSSRRGARQCQRCLGTIQDKDRGYFCRNGYDYCPHCAKSWYAADDDDVDTFYR